MGYVEVLKSGRTRLRLGNHIMYLEMGSTSNIRQVFIFSIMVEKSKSSCFFFVQELVMVDTNVDDRTGSMCDLGQVKHRLVCVPDWQSELAEASRK